MPVPDFSPGEVLTLITIPRLITDPIYGVLDSDKLSF